MQEKNKRLIIVGISSAVGGALGSVSGSSSLVVVSCVSAVIAILVALGISGAFK